MSQNRDAIVLGVTAGAGLLYWLMSGSDKIDIIETEAKCREAVVKLLSHCTEHKVLGFDCEWVVNHSVSLLQLCSSEGYCALFRLNKIGLPGCLEELLENSRIIKVGVEPLNDAARLRGYHGVNVNSTLDLRFMASMTGYKPQNLAGMYKEIVGKSIDKNEAVSNWEATNLSSDQIRYAATDAIAGIEIYKTLSKKFPDLSVLEKYIDTRYSPHRHDNLPRVNSDCVLQ